MGKSITLEEATQFCKQYGFTLIEYSGQMQRLKSRIECDRCGKQFHWIIGTLRQNRQCPTCKKYPIQRVSSVSPNTNEEIDVKQIMLDVKECRQATATLLKEREERRKEFAELRKDIESAVADIKKDLNAIAIYEEYYRGLK